MLKCKNLSIDSKLKRDDKTGTYDFVDYTVCTITPTREECFCNGDIRKCLFNQSIENGFYVLDSITNQPLEYKNQMDNIDCLAITESGDIVALNDIGNYTYIGKKDYIIEYKHK